MRAMPLILAVLPLAAQAEPQTLSLSAGCEAQLSVLDAECVWTHVLACPSDRPGTLRRVAIYEDGPDVTLLDAEGQWLESYSSYDGILWTLAESPSPMSLRELLEAGVDEYDITLRSADGSVQHVQGTDRLTGATTTIDGTPLRVMTFDTEVRDGSGALIQHYRGINHVSEDPPAYHGGPSEDLVAQTTWDSTPVDLARDGDPGFLSVAAPASCVPATPAVAGPAQPEPIQ